MASTSGSPSMSEKNGLLIEQFCFVTGASRYNSYKMLKACDWNLETALNMNYPYKLGSRKRRRKSFFDGFQELSDEEGKSLKRRRTSGDLFRPPLDLMYRGNFYSACNFAQKSNRWLMVNIQNSENLACQLLNSDVWRDQSVKNLINKHFVFWQVNSDSIDGEPCMQYYKPKEFPYIAVIDPRTCEKLVVWHDVDVATLFQLIHNFLKEYNSPNGTPIYVDSSPVKCSLLDESEDDQIEVVFAGKLKESNLTGCSIDDNESEIFESDSSPITYILLDESEDDQIKPAFAASLNESNLTRSTIDDKEKEIFESDSECAVDKLTQDKAMNSETPCDSIDVVHCYESNNKADSSTEDTPKDYLYAEDDLKGT